MNEQKTHIEFSLLRGKAFLLQGFRRTYQARSSWFNDCNYKLTILHALTIEKRKM